MEFTCCFLNCKRLFAPPATSPSEQSVYAGKVQALAETLRIAAGGFAPDLIGLCEIGSEAVGNTLAETLQPGRYGSAWSGDTRSDQTGLMLLYNQHLFSQIALRIDRSTRSDQAQARWMTVLLQCLAGNQGRLWLAVHHWPSPLSGLRAPLHHTHLWSEFSTFFKDEARRESNAMLVLGDFNCEPGDEPLVNQPAQVLVTTREREPLKRRWRDDLFLYNPMWRLMGEVDPHEDTLAAGYRPERTMGTFWVSGQGWQMIDQMFLSSPLLFGPHFAFRERSLRLVPAKDQCSDHYAISLSLEILESV